MSKLLSPIYYFLIEYSSKHRFFQEHVSHAKVSYVRAHRVGINIFLGYILDYVSNWLLSHMLWVKLWYKASIVRHSGAKLLSDKKLLPLPHQIWNEIIYQRCLKRPPPQHNNSTFTHTTSNDLLVIILIYLKGMSWHFSFNGCHDNSDASLSFIRRGVFVRSIFQDIG